VVPVLVLASVVEVASDVDGPAVVGSPLVGAVVPLLLVSPVAEAVVPPVLAASVLASVVLLPPVELDVSLAPPVLSSPAPEQPTIVPAASHADHPRLRNVRIIRAG
jgi:hypothetical protein